ncbi:MAG: DUF1501 domain-containing protein, partial [Planctomycetia bacterium]
MPRPMVRRNLERRAMIGSLGASAVSGLWNDWLRADATVNARIATAKSVVMIFNCGAPSHLDLWDMKPDAPVEIRGSFKSIETSAPGIRVSELMPHIARQAHHLSIVRSVHHGHNAHNSGMYWTIAGRPYPMDSTLINPGRSDIPSFGTLVGWLAQQNGYAGELPPYVITPFPHCDSTAYITPGQYGGCLGSRFDPFVLNRDPNEPNFRPTNLGLEGDVTLDRFSGRERLLAEMATAAPDWMAPQIQTFDSNHERARKFVRSTAVKEAFDLSREPDNVRDRYGRHSWGQSHLLARRLVESGVRFVSTVNGPSITWDTHKDNESGLKDRLVPPADLAYATLIEDLEQRGLLESTLVIWLG